MRRSDIYHGKEGATRLVTLNHELLKRCILPRRDVYTVDLTLDPDVERETIMGRHMELTGNRGSVAALVK